MNKKEFMDWLEPISDEYEIKIFNGEKDVDLEPLRDIDFNKEEMSMVIDGVRNETE